MTKKNILIVTGTGGALGTGHLQRMLALAVHLDIIDFFSVKIFLKQNSFPPDEIFKNLLTETIPENIDLIIRDMRDSTVEEILLLKQIAPVLAIDDSGSGHPITDYQITLLPVPSEAGKPVKPDTSMFLYGYNFSKGMESLAEKIFFDRDIDVAVYAGNDPSLEFVDKIKKAIPETVNSILLTGKEPVILTGNMQLSDTGYAEILCRTKIMITHFGLTMFEAHTCGCMIAALNPTSYHNTLAELMREEFSILYNSEYNFFLPEDLRNVIEKALKNFTDKKISINYIIEEVNKGRNNFTAYLKKIVR